MLPWGPRFMPSPPVTFNFMLSILWAVFVYNSRSLASPVIAFERPRDLKTANLAAKCYLLDPPGRYIRGDLISGKRHNFAQKYDIVGSDRATPDISHVSVLTTPTWTPPPPPESTAPPVPPGVEPGDDENPVNAEDWGYFNLVNGSPYNFVVTHSQSDLMTDRWKWVTIPPGQGYQSYISMTNITSNGEVYYKLDGPGHTFKLFFDRTNGFNVTISLEDRLLDHSATKQLSIQKHFQPDRAVNLVITGTEDLGYWASASPPPDWMQQLWSVIGNRKLKHICMPGSHDAGISLLQARTPFATKENTQTQMSDLYGQLMLGSRYFDIRPVIANRGQFYTGHFGNILGLGNFQGGIGQSIDDIIENINRFLSQYNELIILNLSHTLDADNGYRTFTSMQWLELYQKLKKINHRFISDKTPTITDDLTEMRLNEFISQTEGRVLIIASDAPEALLREGIFARTNFPLFDRYANTPRERLMATDQLQKLESQRWIVADDKSRKDIFFILSWTLTSNVESILRGKSIAHLALDLAYDSLFWRAFNSFTPQSYPNVLYMDFMGTADWAPSIPGQPRWPAMPPNGTYPDVMLLAMAVNLQIASQNSYVLRA